MIPGKVYGPPKRPPPRVYWDTKPPIHLRSPPRGFPPGGGSPPYRYTDDDPRRFPGDSPPQRYLEGPPPGYQDSPPRRFPGRYSEYLSPEDSPPYRYIEDAPRWNVGSAGTSRPFPEDGPLPPDIDGPPPPGLRDESSRRFGGNPPPGYGGYRGEGPHRLVGSESPSPPPGYFPPPPPHPGGKYGDEHPRRFGASVPLQFRRGGSPARHEGRFHDGGSPDHLDEPPRRFVGTPPAQYRDDAPPSYSEEDPVRRFPGARPFPDGSPQRRPEDPTRRFSSTPPRRPVGPPPGYAEDPARKASGTPPRRPDGSPSTHGKDHSREFGAISRGVPLGLPPSIVPLGVPINALHEHPQYPPDVWAEGAHPSHQDAGHAHPRFPPDVFASEARPTTPSSAGTSPPDGLAYRYRGPTPPGGASPDYPLRGGPRFHGAGYEHANLPPDSTGIRAAYRPAPPGLGTNAPLLPPEFVSPPRPAFASQPRRHPDGYTAHTPPREPPMRPQGLGHDAIYTADVIPIELNDELKVLQPQQGNPGSSTGGGWKDLWAAFLFLVQAGGMIGLSVIFGLQGVTSTIRHYGSHDAFHINNWFPQLAAAAIVGAIFSCVWQTALRLRPVPMIQITIWSGAAMMSLFGIVLLATGKNLGLIGLGFLFLGICQGLYAFVVRERIPFAGEMLKKVVTVCTKYPSTFVVSYFFVLVSLAWLAIWIFGLSGSGIRPKHAALMVGFVASLLWTMQVIRNIVRVTVAGTVSLVYFQEKNMPPKPIYISLFRACTSSLGSICLGSLVVPLVEAPFHVLRRINDQAGASEFLFSCVVCLLSCFRILIRYFNRMGYIQVAIYGKPFLRASKDTWKMLQNQEVDILVHDDLTGTIILIACGVGGSSSALVAGIWTFIAHKSLTIVISLLSFVIGGLISYITMAVVESGVATFYVCFAEDPESLQRYDGPLYERMWVRKMELLSPVTELAV